MIPLRIRFDIGDIGSLASQACACHRGTPVLRSVRGRTVNVFKTKNGDRIDGEFFTHLFYGADFIRKFQFYQTDYEHIEVYIESPDSEILRTQEGFFSDMTEKIRLLMGNDCRVDCYVRDRIEPSPSGKFIYTISNLP